MSSFKNKSLTRCGRFILSLFFLQFFLSPIQWVIAAEYILAPAQPAGLITSEAKVVVGDIDGDGDFDAFITQRTSGNN